MNVLNLYRKLEAIASAIRGGTISGGAIHLATCWW